MSYFKRTGTGINDVSWDETELATKAEFDDLNTKVEGISGGTTELPYLPIAGGTMNGSINMGTNNLINVGAPTNPTDGATKKYVDDAVSGVTPTESYLPVSGGTMEGNLNMGNHQITNVDTLAVTNIIVKGTAEASASIKVTGDASRSEIDLNDASNNPVVLKGVNTPADNNDAANKSYVDAVDAKLTTVNSELTGVKNTITNIENGNTVLPYLPISGGTLTGTLTLNANPTEDLQAATKKYIDDKANDHANINVIKAFDSMIANAFRHNKFIFTFIYFVLDAKYDVGSNNNILLCTFDVPYKIVNIDFNIMQLGQGFKSDGSSVGDVPLEIGFSLKDNKLYIVHLLVPTNYNVTKVSDNGSVTQMFAVEE